VARHQHHAGAHGGDRPQRFELLVKSLQLLRPGLSAGTLRPYVPYTQVTTRFQNADEAAMLQEAGISPCADYFPRIVVTRSGTFRQAGASAPKRSPARSSAISWHADAVRPSNGALRAPAARWICA
jgi:hypothetical protein